MNRSTALFFACLLAMLNTGCSTLADAQASRGTGISKVYEKPYDVVWNAVIETVRSSGLALVAENKVKGSVLAQGAISAFSWGENVAIYVEDVGGKIRTRVEVVNKRALATNITAADWESRIIEALDMRLPATPIGAQSQPSDSVSQKLRELQNLRKDGVITENEFQTKKEQLLQKL